MDKPKTINDITRCISAQAFNGMIRDIKFNSSVEKSLQEFLKSAKPILYETLSSLMKENRPLKICTTLHFGRNHSIVYATRLDNYVLSAVISRLIKDIEEKDMVRAYKPNTIFLIMNTTVYDRNLERKYLQNQNCNSSSDEDDCVFY